MIVTWVDIFLISMIALIFIVDGVLFKRAGEPGTISFRLARWSSLYPLIPFLAGVLAGHLFWPNRGYC